MVVRRVRVEGRYHWRRTYVVGKENGENREERKKGESTMWMVGFDFCSGFAFAPSPGLVGRGAVGSSDGKVLLIVVRTFVVVGVPGLQVQDGPELACFACLLDAWVSNAHSSHSFSSPFACSLYTPKNIIKYSLPHDWSKCTRVVGGCTVPRSTTVSSSLYVQKHEKGQTPAPSSHCIVLKRPPKSASDP